MDGDGLWMADYWAQAGLWALVGCKYWITVNTVRRYKSTAGYKKGVVRNWLSVLSVQPQVWPDLPRFGCNMAESGVKWPK